MPGREDVSSYIDDHILHAIAQGTNQLYRLVARTSYEERAIDRALQRLRKQGKIEYGGPGKPFVGWRVKEKNP
jgi:hypothetical protein